MINIKSFSIIDKNSIKGNIHIVGVGALGSMIAMSLIRLNLTSKIIAYDYDVVEDKNLNNQSYLHQHIGTSKVEALKELASMVDPSSELRIRNKKVEWLRLSSDDVLILAVDSFTARVNILKSLTDSPLVISGGISSIGGNIEVTRGDYQNLIKEYENTDSQGEYDENDLTACGSPISIFPRIQYAASIACEQLIQEHSTEGLLSTNILFDVPNKILIEC